jgi:hypothetical protein
MEWSEVDSKRIKLVLSMVGAGAVLAMGGLTVTYADEGPRAQGPVVAAPERTADEPTESTARGVPETSVAVPPITTPPYTIPTGEPQ